MILVTALYLGVNTAYIAVLGREGMVQSEAVAVVTYIVYLTCLTVDYQLLQIGPSDKCWDIDNITLLFIYIFSPF